MDYDFILKIVMGMKDRKNDDDDRTCYICHFPIKENEKVLSWNANIITIQNV